MPKAPRTELLDPFVAIDFETADHGRDSACAVALVRVERGAICRRECRLIRAPRSDFVFSYIHGISWDDVASEPDFGAVWSELRDLPDGVAFLAAHNASFDRRVLNACCQAAGAARCSSPGRSGGSSTPRSCRTCAATYASL